jgi:hypothetical protein
MENKYYSQAGQDKFAANLFDFSPKGYFVDVGCWHPITNNNSYFLETLGWEGICIDRDFQDYSSRKAKYYNLDALEINYKELFESNNFPSVIDYLSLDLDVPYTLTVLEKIIDTGYEFKFLTVEHDWYNKDERLPCREEMRKLLLNKNYFLLHSDVWISNHEYFEDWWVHPEYFDLDGLTNLKTDKLNYTDIVNTLK